MAIDVVVLDSDGNEAMLQAGAIVRIFRVV